MANIMPVMFSLGLVRRQDGWWVTGVPLHDVPQYGPYHTKAEAADCMKRTARFFKEHPQYASDTNSTTEKDGAEWNTSKTSGTGSTTRQAQLPF
jgi:hypothetical protein